MLQSWCIFVVPFFSKTCCSHSGEKNKKLGYPGLFFFIEYRPQIWTINHQTWLKCCCSFSFVKLIHNCSKLRKRNLWDSRLNSKPWGLDEIISLPIELKTSKPIDIKNSNNGFWIRILPNQIVNLQHINAREDLYRTCNIIHLSSAKGSLPIKQTGINSFS